MQGFFIHLFILDYLLFLIKFGLFGVYLFCGFCLQLNRFQGLASLDDITAIISTPPLGGFQVDTPPPAEVDHNIRAPFEDLRFTNCLFSFFFKLSLFCISGVNSTRIGIGSIKMTCACYNSRATFWHSWKWGVGLLGNLRPACNLFYGTNKCNASKHFLMSKWTLEIIHLNSTWYALR